MRKPVEECNVATGCETWPSWSLLWGKDGHGAGQLQGGAEGASASRRVARVLAEGREMPREGAVICVGWDCSSPQAAICSPSSSLSVCTTAS